MSVYIENVGESATKMREETLAAMTEWKAFFDQVAPGMLEKLLDSNVSNWQVDMQNSGMKLFMDRGDEFIAADKLWRIQYPDQAELEPLD